MNKTWNEEYKALWDNRYREQEYAYGKEPNEFFKEHLQRFSPGSILMPADGEGRNGVFAAQCGWRVTSLDLSTEGKVKALQLASERNVSIDYLVGDLEELHFGAASFDAIGLVYAHFGADRKQALHQRLAHWLKPGGVVIFEAFSKRHLDLYKLNPSVGGPRDIAMLFSEEEMTTYFAGYEIVVLEEREIGLSEGAYHIGTGSVIRFVGKKPA